MLGTLKADEKQGEYDDDEKMQLRVDVWFYVFWELSLIYFIERNSIRTKHIILMLVWHRNSGKQMKIK